VAHDLDIAESVVDTWMLDNLGGALIKGVVELHISGINKH